MNQIKINVNGIDISAKAGSTILEAVNAVNIAYAEIDIPTLYYLEGIQDEDKSGIAMVEVEGRGLVNASVTEAEDGMVIQTDSEAAVENRKSVLHRIADVHDHQCSSCIRTDNCELQALFYKYEIDDEVRAYSEFEVDFSSIVVRDANKCVRCHRCSEVCRKVQGIEAIKPVGEEFSVVMPVGAGGLSATKCVNCGQCITACPVGALHEKDDTEEVAEALQNPEKFVIAQVAPSVRASLGEEFEFPIGCDVEKRIPAALRALGFDKVFDTDFGADLTIMEEANEFLQRIKNGGTLPMFTSCCPGWIKYCEEEFPDMIPHLSTCKSPHQMLGAVTKTYYAEKLGIAKEKITVVSIMPCTAKKFEITREDECGAGVPDVDYSITTRELARLIKKLEVPFEAVPFEPFDEPLGIGTGAAVIFGATGGVMEAALRTAVEILDGTELEKLEFAEVRGVEGIKEAAIEAAGQTIRIAVVSGLANAKTVLESIREGKAHYDFVEFMACPGGCVNGGGQPVKSALIRAKHDLRAERAAALYQNDQNCVIRKSHENPSIKELYAAYLKEPGSSLAHQLLHTSYTVR